MAMDGFVDIDWNELIKFSVPATELIVRGTAMYWFLFLIFRFAIRRDVGAVGIADILLLVIVADASQNAMAGEYTSVSEGMVLVATLIGWNILLDWLSFRFDFIRRFVEPSPLCLVKNGKFLKRNMRREFITEQELWVKLREEGVESLGEVKNAFLEPDGEISVIKSKG
jgi:uncharacterized membrane protein YcaP (DUF421 family)